MHLNRDKLWPCLTIRDHGSFQKVLCLGGCTVGYGVLQYNSWRYIKHWCTWSFITYTNTTHIWGKSSLSWTAPEFILGERTIIILASTYMDHLLAFGLGPRQWSIALPSSRWGILRLWVQPENQRERRSILREKGRAAAGRCLGGKLALPLM